MNAQRKPSTPKQRSLIHAIALGKRGLNWDKPTYHAFLEGFGVSSSTQLDSGQAASAINHLKALRDGRASDIDGAAAAEQRKQAWNAALCSRFILDGSTSPRPADAPPLRDLHHCLGSLFDLCKSKRNPIGYAKSILAKIIGTDRIYNNDQCRRIIRALKMRGRKQGSPTRRKQ